MKPNNVEKLEMAKIACLEYKDELEKIGIKCHSIYFGEAVEIGPDGDDSDIVENSALLILDHEIEKYEQVYTLGKKIELKYKENNIEIDFMTMEKNEYFNETAVLADGYTHRYKNGNWKINEMDLTSKTFKTKWV